MLLGKARLKLLLLGGFFLISVFCYRISALRLSREDGCVEKKEESLVPLISVAPLQQGSSQTLRPQCDRKAHSIPAPTRPQQTPAHHALLTGPGLERRTLPFSGWPGALPSRSSRPGSLDILIHTVAGEGGLGRRAAACRPRGATEGVCLCCGGPCGANPEGCSVPPLPPSHCPLPWAANPTAGD